jgi:hypothetical protein
MTLTLLEKSTQVWIGLDGYDSYLEMNAAIFGYWDRGGVVLSLLLLILKNV